MQSQPTGLRWEPFEPRSPNAGAGHSADAAKKAVSPGLEWRSWRTTGSQSRESFIPGPTSVSPSGTRGKSRMHKGARTDPCGGRGVTRAPTATRKRVGGYDSFFDVFDIPIGLRFNKVLLEKVRISAVV